MEKLKKISAPLLVFIMICCLSGCARTPAPTEPPATEPQPVIAVQQLDSLSVTSEEIRIWTGAKLYKLSTDGSTIIPELAASEPADVTAQYAGTFGIPENAARGYAFQIDLNENACWEDGAPITAEDYLAAFEKLLEQEKIAAEWSSFANAEAYLAGNYRPGNAVVSLAEAGFESAAQAEEAGYGEFYLNVAAFWGVGEDWVPVEDTARLRDHAMPAGLNEMYISAAYLYETYLRSGAEYDYLQREFVGVTANAEPLTLEDVGFLKTGEHQLTLILTRPTTGEALALKLADFPLISDLSCGPYRVVSADETLLELHRNENWWGEGEFPADILRFRRKA